MVHASAPYHMGSSDRYLSLKRSNDSITWTEIKTFKVSDGGEIRDPKLTVINNTLFLYTLRNEDGVNDASPYATAYFKSTDGVTWSEIYDLDSSLNGWLFWRPKTLDNLTWYVAAYWHEHGESILLNSPNGEDWEIISTIHNGDGNDETTIEIYDNGTIMAIGCFEIVPDTATGDNEGGTFVKTSNFPYTDWEGYVSHDTRIDGPVMFKIDNEIYALGRYQPRRDAVFNQLGGALETKRTAIYHLDASNLNYLSDLPSQGDTSYPGVVVKEDCIITCYYSSDIANDYPWFLGMLQNANIYVANISIESIQACVLSPLEYKWVFSWGSYLVGFGILTIEIVLIACKLKHKKT